MGTDAEQGEPINTGESQPQGPPPAYDSLYGKLLAERAKTSDNKEFMANGANILSSSVGFIIFLAVSMVLPVCMIVFGSLNLQNCPVQRLIPIWLIVAGATSAILQFINIVNGFLTRKREGHQNLEEGDKNSTTSGGNGILGCFNFVWFICGNVWVFGVHNRVVHDDDASDNYCDGTAYNLAFWSIIAAYIFIGFFCFCGCCVACCVGKAVASAKNEDN